VVAELVAADNAEAHCLLGYLTYRGQGVAKDDARSRHHHQIAAERGVAPAQFELSIYCENGTGGPVDGAAARSWEQRAADQGHGRACLNVASWAATGAHGPLDLERAVTYYERAAATGYADAARRLALMYYVGGGVAEDVSAAIRWASIADALGAVDTLSSLLGGEASDDRAAPVSSNVQRLHDAISEGDVEAVRVAIADGADVEALDYMERTPLMAAASEGHIEIVQALLDAGADPNHYRVEVMFVAVLDTALKRAREGKHRAVVKLLEEAGALEAKDLPDPNALAVEASGTPHERLVDALWGDDEARVRKALADGADANGDAHDQPVLAAAVRLRKPGYVKLLLEAGADPNTRDSGEPVLLQWVFDEAGVECFEALLAGGADPNVRSKGVDAVANLPPEAKLRLRMLRALLARGFEVDRRDADGYTLLARAVEQSDVDAFELLLEHGADHRVAVGTRKRDHRTLAQLAEDASGKGSKKIRTRLQQLGVAPSHPGA
jgi:ankyrin repeat protein